MRRALLLAGCWLLAACQGPDVGPTVWTEVLDYDPQQQKYQLKEVQLQQLESIYTLRGKHLEVLGGTTFGDEIKSGYQLDLSGGSCSVQGVKCSADFARLRQVIVGDSEVQVRPRYHLDGDVFRPLDYHTLAMTTAYYQLSAVHRLFRQHGWPADSWGRAPLYYAPRPLGRFKSYLPVQDNAFYFKLLDGFIVLPMKKWQQIPLATNRGVLFHEGAHRLFLRQVVGNVYRLLPANTTTEHVLAVNRLQALDEGLADFFGAVASGDPDFLHQSVPAALAASRDLSTPRTMDASWIKGDRPRMQSSLSYNPYAMGAVYAHCLWILSQRSSTAAVLKAWRGATAQLAAAVQQDLRGFTFATPVNLLVAQLGSADRAAACAIFTSAMAPVRAEITACP